jgi:hypothetical protein
VGDTASPARIQTAADHIDIAARSQAQVRALLGTDIAGRRVRSLSLLVSDWRAPWPGWSGTLGPVRGVVEQAVSVPSSGRGAAQVTIRVNRAMSSSVLIEAALAVLDPGRPLPAALSPETAVTDGQRPPWLLATKLTHTDASVAKPSIGRVPRSRASGEGGITAPQPGSVPATDIQLIGAPGSATTDSMDSLVSTRFGVRPGAGRYHVLVDATSANPIGRGPRQDTACGALTMTTDDEGQAWWRIHSTGDRPGLVAAGRAGDLLDVRHREALRRLDVVTATGPSGDVPDPAQASVLAQLAMTGLVIHASRFGAGVTALIAPELACIIEAPLPGQGADPIELELRSIAQRRAALRGHSTDLRMYADGVMHGRAALPSVSALLVTRRPNRLERAVVSLAEQTYPNLEIVVGLHGVELDDAQRGRLARIETPVEVVSLPADLPFGAALAAVTGRARGSLVAKVDDDDIYGPEHVWDLVLARHYSGATVVGKAAEFVHIGAYGATVRRRMSSELYSDIVAGAALLVGRGDLEAVGGWRPLPRAVDRAMLDRVLGAGGLIYRTHGFGFIATRHSERHTWDPGPAYFVLNPLRHWSGLPGYAEFGALSGDARHQISDLDEEGL